MDLASARTALRAHQTRGRVLLLSQSFLLFTYLPQEVQDKIITLALPAPTPLHRVDFQLMAMYDKHFDTTTTIELRNAAKIALACKQFHALYKMHVLPHLRRRYTISFPGHVEYIRAAWLSGLGPILPPKPWDKVDVEVHVERNQYDEGNCVVFHMRVEHVLNCFALHVNSRFANGHGPDCLLRPRVGWWKTNVFLRSVAVDDTDVDKWDKQCTYA